MQKIIWKKLPFFLDIVETKTAKRVEAETVKRMEAEITKRVEAETSKRVEAEGIINNSVKSLMSNLNFTLDQALDVLDIRGVKRTDIISSLNK